MKRPYILITNDDGYTSNGIKVLCDVMCRLGDVIVVAPDGARSGMSAAITPAPPLTAEKFAESKGCVWYKCSGTPVDCIKLAFAQILEKRPDLIVSGINHGSNAGINVLYSATMGAVFEGCVQDIPSIGFSLCSMDEEADFTASIEVVYKIAKKILQVGLPKDVCLNVNIPYCKDIRGIRLCSQTPSRWINEFGKEYNERGEVVYPIGGEVTILTSKNSKDDLWALDDGWVAVVPLHLDRTNYEYLEKHKNLFEEG